MMIIGILIIELLFVQNIKKKKKKKKRFKKKVWVNSPTNFVAWWDGDKIHTLDCKTIDPNNKPHGFLKKAGKYQYDLRNKFPEQHPSAWRIPFFFIGTSI
jgi:hypothetical protein